MKLPEPMTSAGTKQTGMQFIFSLNLETYIKLAAMEQKKELYCTAGNLKRHGHLQVLDNWFQIG